MENRGQSQNLGELPIIELEGTPREMGRAFGELCRDDIREFYGIRMKLAILFAREHGRRLTEEGVLGVCRESVKLTQEFDPEGYEEFCAIGEAAGLSPEQTYSLNGLTDLRDVLAYSELPDGLGCSSFVVGPDRAAGGQLLLGQTWDLYTSNMKFVMLVHRKPSNAPETLCVTTAGCLSLIGINSEGLAVGNTNLQTTDSRIGVQYLSILHRALRCTELEEAAGIVAGAPRAGAHYYYVGGPDGRAVGLECSATRSARFALDTGTFVHCNHCLDSELAELEVPPSGDSTFCRQTRLSSLMQSYEGEIGIEAVKEMLSDHEGGELAICRHHGADGVSTNACIIMSPGTHEIHACRSQPHEGRWVSRKL